MKTRGRKRVGKNRRKTRGGMKQLHNATKSVKRFFGLDTYDENLRHNIKEINKNNSLSEFEKKRQIDDLQRKYNELKDAYVKRKASNRNSRSPSMHSLIREFEHDHDNGMSLSEKRRGI